MIFLMQKRKFIIKRLEETICFNKEEEISIVVTLMQFFLLFCFTQLSDYSFWGLVHQKDDYILHCDQTKSNDYHTYFKQFFIRF